jgi:hypothetical protein
LFQNEFAQIGISITMQVLQDVGATTITGLKDGIRPRMVGFFQRIAKRIAAGTASFHEMRPVLEFVARNYHPAWLLLAEMQREFAGAEGLDASAHYLRCFLEEESSGEEAQAAWQQLITIYRATGNVVAKFPNILQNPPKSGFWGAAHGSVSLQEGQPTSDSEIMVDFAP